MEYDWKFIGKRIKDERKQLSLTQEQLIEKMGFSSRQLLSRWEKGTSKPTLEDLLALCKIFECEVGYLLCEHNCTTREKTDIQDVTGLSEKSIDLLKVIKDGRHSTWIRESGKKDIKMYTGNKAISPFIINSIFENVDFWSGFDDLLSSYIHAKDRNKAVHSSEISASNAARYSLSRLFEKLIDDTVTAYEAKFKPKEFKLQRQKKNGQAF